MKLVWRRRREEMGVEEGEVVSQGVVIVEGEVVMAGLVGMVRVVVGVKTVMVTLVRGRVVKKTWSCSLPLCRKRRLLTQQRTSQQAEPQPVLPWGTLRETGEEGGERGTQHCVCVCVGVLPRIPVCTLYFRKS